MPQRPSSAATCLVSYLAGDTTGTHAILGDTVTAEPWEDVVGQCLSILCSTGQPPTAAQNTASLDAYRHLGAEPELAVFVTRLGLTVTDTFGGSGRNQTHVSLTAHELIARVISWQDGYAARDLLAHEETRASRSSRSVTRAPVGNRGVSEPIDYAPQIDGRR
jgi:hypothetical protein